MSERLEEYRKSKKYISDLISVIIPVYNVADYLDECLYSVVNQTYDKLEIILINDGSTDLSGEKCVEWSKKDSRIIYIEKENEGLPLTRNLGLKMATGEYIAFIDSDDWIENKFCELLIEKAKRENADIVECDFWRFDNNTGKSTYKMCNCSLGKDFDLEHHITHTPSMSWKYISRHELWDKNNIVFPNCAAASFVVYVELLMVCERVMNIHEGLYHYRRFRKGSIVENASMKNSDANAFGIDSIRHLMKYLYENNIFESNYKLVDKIVSHRISENMASQFVRKEDADFCNYADALYGFLQSELKKTPIKYASISGYNLVKALEHLSEVNNPYLRFSFSSIISIMNEVTNADEVEHKNKYRRKMINRDIKSDFWRIVKEEKIDYLFIDLIDNRFDIEKIEDGFITLSDAYDEVNEDSTQDEKVEFASTEFLELWEYNAERFADRIAEVIPQNRIIVVENYLAESYGMRDMQHFYDNLDEIRMINNTLRRMYDILITKLKCCRVVKTNDLDEYYTDDKFEYGVLPSHLNEWVNIRIAERINACISEENENENM